jgi:hypothetical protein
LDGGDGETVEYTRIAALRALERLRENVRVVAHANRVGWSRGDPRVLLLFDRLLRVVPFDSRDRAFHPKVTLARQQGVGFSDRYVLAVGSRNLTSSEDWDFGVGLVGYATTAKPARTQRLPHLSGFTRALCVLTGEPDLSERFGDLDAVAWELPEGIDHIEFRSHEGEPREFSSTVLARLDRVGRVLLLSPFLSAELVTLVAKRFARADEVRLVGGLVDLARIGNGGARKQLKQFGGGIDPFSMTAASDEAPCAESDLSIHPEIDDEAAAADEAAIEERDLHAKVFAVSDGASAQLIVGSANLTGHAWLGRNWEALVSLRGDAVLFEQLWEWTDSHAHLFQVGNDSDSASEPRDSVDDLRNLLATRTLTLDETSDARAVLTCADMPALLKTSGCALRVSRYAGAFEWAAWDTRSTSIALAPCKSSERSEFILMIARRDDNEASWIQKVRVVPTIDQTRDREAFVAILGVSDFLRYLQSLIDENADSSDDNENERKKRGANRHNSTRPTESFRLESFLRQLARKSEAFEEIDRTVTLYADLVSRTHSSDTDRTDVDRFLAAWSAISQGMAMR